MKSFALFFTLLLSGLIHAQYGIKQELGPIPDLGWSSIQHITVDLDQDGDFDVVCAGSGGLGWIENLGINVYAEYVELNDVGISDFDITDYNNDGSLDIIYASLGLLKFYENNGEESFLTPVTIGWYFMGTSGEKIECADMNGDGIEDIITRATFNRIVWRVNPGTGAATGDEFVIEIDDPIVQDWEIIDIDDDGDMDICWVDYGADEGLWIGRNLGDGTFERDTIYKELDIHPLTINFADMNNDGLLDVVFSGVFRVGWVENLGAGVYSDLNVLTTDPYDPRVVQTGDVDLDGFVDIVYTDPDANKLILIRNLDGESFDDPVSITGELTEPGDIDLIDIDFDGDLDIVSGEIGGPSLGYFRNHTINLFGVEGQFYIDLNENGIREEGEVGLPYATIGSTPLSAYTATNYDGSYFMDFYGMPEGVYEIAPDIDFWAVSSLHESYDVMVDSPFVSLDTLDFGMYPQTPTDSIIISLIGPSIYRCNLANFFDLNILNIGGTIPSGGIHFVLDDSLTYLSADLEPDSIVGQNIYWSYTDLFYFESRNIQLSALFPDGVEDVVTCVVSANVLEDGVSVFDAEPDSETETVTCAYDPNDKKVSPKGAGEFGNIPPETEWLEYTIRFQNTGTDTAFQVIIRDQLDEDLDWFSFIPLTSSHDMNVDFDPSGEIAFIFENIMLPDSNVNYAGSQGYMRYRIRPKADLMIGTTIENTAGIYFDANPVVLTNTTLNTIHVDVDNIVENESFNLNAVVYPNPATDEATVFFNQELSEDYVLKIYNLLGELEYSFANINSNQLTIDLSTFSRGLYILAIENISSNQQVYCTKFIKN
ncbi:MAG: T9SS type A sorting domain-containing protein [Crocinitomix sp.]|nr:T9SS type A sorting domain-containing protein [Crocinitomix sp.]